MEKCDTSSLLLLTVQTFFAIFFINDSHPWRRACVRVMDCDNSDKTSPVNVMCIRVCVLTTVHCDDGPVVLCEAETWGALLRRRAVHLCLLYSRGHAWTQRHTEGVTDATRTPIIKMLLKRPYMPN